jgi:spore maturation protein CgeB
MRLAFFGSSVVSAYWNGAATYYRGMLRALAARGHANTFFEPDAFDRQAHRDLADPGWTGVVVFPPTLDGVQEALQTAREADVVVKYSGVGVLDEELEAGVLALRRPGQSVIFWDVDAPATLDRMAADPSDPLRALVPRYDAVFTYGGGEAVVKAYRGFGAHTCMPIYNALDPSTHHPVEREERFAADLAFLGNRLPDREARVEEFLLKPAAALSGKTFLLGGNGWADKPTPDNIRKLGHVYTRDHNAINCSATAVLNINRDSMARYGASPPTRIFEAAGAGACIITDAWDGIGDFLDPGEEVLVANSGDDVRDILRNLTPERARAIGAAARRRVLAEHTYARRAAEFDAILSERWRAAV